MADRGKFKFSPKKQCYALIYEHTSSYTHLYYHLKFKFLKLLI